MSLFEVNLQCQEERGIVTPNSIDEAKPGDQIRWAAINSDMTLFFPDINLFGLRDLDIPEGGNLILEIREVENGKYPYDVYFKAIEDYSDQKANRPIIIIER